MGFVAKRTYSESDVTASEIILGYKAFKLSITNLNNVLDLIVEIPQFNNTTNYYAKIPPLTALNNIPLTEFDRILFVQNSTKFSINVFIEQQGQVRIA